MKMSKCIGLIAIGAMSTIMYQQIKNGNMKKLIKEMDKMKLDMVDDLEDMM